MTRLRRHTARRAVAVKLLEITVAIAFLLLMINIVVPWAVGSLTDGFAMTVQESR
jgi:tripartite-type tricarboxylate transporter receptor subunit TctC